MVLVHDHRDVGIRLDGRLDEVALGTDYPFPLGELQPGQLVRSMPWDDKQKELVLSGAALQWLGLERGAFT